MSNKQPQNLQNQPQNDNFTQIQPSINLPSGFTQIDLLNNDIDKHEYIDQFSGEIIPFPEILAPYRGSSGEEFDSENEVDPDSIRRKMFKQANRETAKIPRRPDNRNNNKSYFKVAEIEKFTTPGYLENLTVDDIPKNIEPPKTEKTGQTQEEFDELLRVLYLEKEDYPHKKKRRNFKPSLKKKFITDISCPYSHCDFTGEYWRRVLEHIETQHDVDPDKGKLSELDWGMKMLYRSRVGRSKFCKSDPDVWKCPYRVSPYNCEYESKKCASTRKHVETVHKQIKFDCPVPGCETKFTSKVQCVWK